VTVEHIQAYMKGVKGYNEAEDMLVISDYAIPVDLDAREAEQ
jgi:hypothetical protein